MCCSFNLEKAEEMFHSGIFADNIEKQQAQDSEWAFDKNSPKWVRAKDLMNSGIRPEPTSRKGLRVILDSHSDILSSSSLRSDGQGFVAMVSPR